METLRLVCYVVGILMAFVMAGQLVRIQHSLARLLAAAMLAWAVNSVTLFLLLFFVQFTGAVPVWRDIITTINAILLATVPVVLYIFFLRGRHDSNP